MFPRLKLMVGIAHDEDRKRRKKQEEEEKERLDRIEQERRTKAKHEQMNILRENVEASLSTMEGIEKEITLAEENARPLCVQVDGGRLTSSKSEVKERADAVDAAECREGSAGCRPRSVGGSRW